MSDKSSIKQIAQNRKARHDYTVTEQLEAGIMLSGTEVKAIRQGHVSLAGSFARIEQGACWIHKMNVSHYDHGNRFNHEQTRPRKLLLHRREIDRLQQLTEQKGLTLVPLSLYLRGGWVKIKIGVCKGKTHGDKRETLKRRSADLDARRAIRRHG